VCEGETNRQFHYTRGETKMPEFDASLQNAMDVLSFAQDVERLADSVSCRADIVLQVMGPLAEMEAAHLMLDELGVPRELMPGGGFLSLPNRIAYLNGMLVSARVALARSGCFVVSRKVTTR
jgi:hypothetical protein